MFKKFIQNNYDIDDDVLEYIKNEEILKEELKHINSLLQQNGMFSSKFLVFVIGLVVTGISSMIWQMHNFFIMQLPSIKNLSNLSYEVNSLISDILLFSIGFYTLFFMVLVSSWLYGKGLKRRKKLIIHLLNNMSIENDKHKKEIA